MFESLVNQIIDKLPQATELYHRLIFIVAPAGEGKTSALRNVKDRIGIPLININLDISRALLDLTGRQRALQIPKLLNEIVAGVSSDVILLDNIEILFDVSLKQDPLRLLQGISRNRTIVAAWNGSLTNGYLTYAGPEHPEYRKYPVHDFLVVSKEAEQ